MNRRARARPLPSELRQSLTDLEEFFDILATQSDLPDGDRDLPLTPLAHAAGGADTAAAGEPGNGHMEADGATADALAARRSSHALAGSSNGSSSGMGLGMGGSLASDDFGVTDGLEVELSNVRFGYSPAREVLKGVSLRIEAGESLAIVGGSGSGKSTILKLVTRLYDTISGDIKV